MFLFVDILYSNRFLLPNWETILTLIGTVISSAGVNMSDSAKKRSKKRKKNQTPTKLSETSELISVATTMTSFPGMVTPQPSGNGQYVLNSPQFSPQFLQQPIPPHFVQTLQQPFSQHFVQSPQNAQNLQNPQIQPQPQIVNMHELFKRFDERFDEIQKKLEKLDSIESTMTDISARVSRLEFDTEKKIHGIEATVLDIENGVTFLSSKYDEQTKFNQEIKNDVNKLSEELINASAPGGGEAVRGDVEVLSEKILDMQIRDMRDNLIFKGLAECEGENCEALVKQFIVEKLEVRDDIEFVRVHRIGKPQNREKANTQGASGGATATPGNIPTGEDSSPGPNRVSTDVRPRSIVARFERFRDRERVRLQAIDRVNVLKNNDIYIDEQFPREIEARRRILYPIRGASKYAGDDVKLVIDKLYINKRLYVPGKPVPNSNCARLRVPHDPEDIRKARSNYVASKLKSQNVQAHPAWKSEANGLNLKHTGIDELTDMDTTPIHDATENKSATA